jgi:hypothetical protein
MPGITVANLISNAALLIRIGSVMRTREWGNYISNGTKIISNGSTTYQ